MSRPPRQPARIRPKVAHAVLVFALIVCKPCAAVCEANSLLSSTMSDLIDQKFPALVPERPLIFTCPDEDFPPPKAGMYRDPDHLILIANRVLKMTLMDIRLVIAHELAHAAARKLPRDNEHGHGPNFYRELAKAGFTAEAIRVAAQYNNPEDLIKAGIDIDAQPRLPGAPKPVAGARPYR